MSNKYAEAIKDQLDPREVLAYYGVQFNSRGFAPCPFHNEKTASFSTKGKYYKCFGCGASGGVIDFTMQYFGISFQQAILKLDADFHLHLIDSNKPRKSAMNRELREEHKIDAAYNLFRESLHQEILELSHLHAILFRQQSLGNDDPTLDKYIKDLELRIEMQEARYAR